MLQHVTQCNTMQHCVTYNIHHFGIAYWFVVLLGFLPEGAEYSVSRICGGNTSTSACVCMRVEGGEGECMYGGGVYVWRGKQSISMSLTVSVPVLSGLRYQPVSIVWWDGGVPLQTTPFSILLPYRKETYTCMWLSPPVSVLIKGYL